jgi:hypothetical protein
MPDNPALLRARDRLAEQDQLTFDAREKGGCEARPLLRLPSRRGELTAMGQHELPNRGCQGLAKFRRGGKVRPRAHLSELSSLKPFGEPRSQSCRVAPVGSRNDQSGHIDRDELLDGPERTIVPDRGGSNSALPIDGRHTVADHRPDHGREIWQDRGPCRLGTLLTHPRCNEGRSSGGGELPRNG